MAVTQLIYPDTPGLVAQPTSELVGGSSLLTSLPLAKIQMNADFGNVTPEVFYQELYDGESAELPESNTDGYQYSASECIWSWERRSTVSDEGGTPSFAGGILILNDYLDPVALKAKIQTQYMVQGGETNPSSDGILGVWCFAIRGRGLVTIPSGLSFTYDADSAFAKGTAISQTLIRRLSARAQLSPVIVEVFTDAGQGVSWTAGATPAVNSFVKPSWGKANGCYYQAASVIGPQGAIEPTWTTAIDSLVIDGGVIWVCVGRGFSNGQSFNMPTSPFDGHAYSSGEMIACIPSYLTTGQASGIGPSGAGRVQRLQKSAPGGAVSTATTYWDGNNQSGTADGVVHCVGIFMRALPSYPSVPPAYNVMGGDEFLSGHGLAITETGASFNDLQLVNQNALNAAVRPEPFSDTGISNAGAPTLPTSHSGYSYSREECMNVFSLADTGAVSAGVDRALRLFVLTIDSGSGLVSTRVDYNVGGNPVTTQNGSLNIVVMASRDSNNLLSGLATIGFGGGAEPAPVGVNGVPNGSFEIFPDVEHFGTQLVGVPALWSISNNTADGYTTKQTPGIDSATAVGLNVGNAHAAANTQYVSLLSYPIAISPGDLYSYSLWAYAEKAGTPGTGISMGFIVRCHIRDENFANDVSFDLVPNQALGFSPKQFNGRFTMPMAGDTTVTLSDGTAISLSGGAVPSNPTFFYYEIWNFKPNVSSAVFVDDMQLIDVQAATATLSTSATNIVDASGNPLNPLVGTPTTIIVNPFYYQSGGFNIPCLQGSSYTISGLANNTKYLVYFSDPQLRGGSITPIATTNLNIAQSLPGIVVIGTVATTSPGTGGGSVTYRPTTYLDNGGLSTSNPQSAYDGNTVTYAELQSLTLGSPVGWSRCSWYGIPDWPSTPTSPVLNVYSAHTTSIVTAIIEYSTDGGSTWTTIRSSASTWNASSTPDQISLSPTVHWDQVQVRARYTTAPGSTNDDILEVFEVFITATL